MTVTASTNRQGSGVLALRFVLRKAQQQRPLVIGLTVIAVLWQISTYFLPPIITPPLQDIGASIWSIFSDPKMLVHLLTTGTRVLVALIASFIVGAVIGLLMGTFDKVREYVKPILNFIQGVPALSWVIFAVIWFANVEFRIGFVLLIVTMPAFALYIDGAVRSVNLDLVHLGQAFRASRLQRFRMIVIPAIIPQIISAWVVNLGQGVRVAMVAELIGSNVGVGFQLLNSQAVFDMAGAIAWTLSLVLLLSVFQLTISIAESRLLAWRPKGEQA
jgi:ABC-type nitrate/sulfonate/bicarbonate transport system permease component